MNMRRVLKRAYFYLNSERVRTMIVVMFPESSNIVSLKVSKRENFSLAFFALSEPTWACDLGSGEKNRIFYQMIPDFEG